MMSSILISPENLYIQNAQRIQDIRDIAALKRIDRADQALQTSVQSTAQDENSVPTPSVDFGPDFNLNLSAHAQRQFVDGPQKTNEIQSAQPEKNELSEAEKEQVEKLKERDAEVKQHEQAHMAAAGAYAKGGPKYDFQQGPDNKQYAVGGSVDIDTSPISGDPAATIQKARQIAQAATAPGEPSPQDQQVAAQAQKMQLDAAQKLQEKQNQENNPSQKGQASFNSFLNKAMNSYTQNGSQNRNSHSGFQAFG